MIKPQKAKSFTLIELIVTIGIILVLVVLGALAFRTFQKESNLANNTEEIINILRFAQNKTLASEDASTYGIHFENDKFVLFKGAVYDPLASDNDVYNLSSSVEINEINLAGGASEVIFDRVTGTTVQSGNISLRSKLDLSKTRVVYIESSGQVGLSVPSTPSDENRVKDSRHVHFDLGWSIENATTLKFDFIDAVQIETIAMSEYFNTEKTEFDWEETFSVGGADQVFRIHTHLLDISNTLLCIHRDRNEGKNTERVRVFIVDGGVDKDIAHYLADANDTVEKGFYVNTMEKQ